MDRRTVLAGVAIGTAAPWAAAQAPARAGLVRLGVLGLRPPVSPNPLNDALIAGLRERGYVQGRNLLIDFPDAEGREDRLPAIAAQMVGSGVDVILILGPAPLQAAREATRTIPLVMVASSSDPVAEGIAASLSRPGGNVTGLTYAEPGRFQKQLELLKAAGASVRRLAVLWDFDIEVYRRQWEKALTDAGRVLGVSIQEPVRVHSALELPAAFETLKRRDTDALLVASGGITFPARTQVAALALEHRLPGIAAFKEFAQAGLLMSYGPDLADINRRAAGFVDKIVKGMKPADLPIELPAKFDFAINRRTAQALGMTIPPSLLIQTNVAMP